MEGLDDPALVRPHARSRLQHDVRALVGGRHALTAWYVYATLDWWRDNLYRKGTLEVMLQLAAVGIALFLLVAVLAGVLAVARRGRPLHGALAALQGIVLFAGVVWAFLLS
jgi:hypothetical protein